MPSIFVIAGPNGAGKSTAAPTLLRDEFKIPIYVNADTIAAGLSAFDPESAAFQAGRIMRSSVVGLALKSTCCFSPWHPLTLPSSAWHYASKAADTTSRKRLCDGDSSAA